MKWTEESDNATTCQAAFLRLNVWCLSAGRFGWEVKCAGFVLDTGVSSDLAAGKGAAELCLWELSERLAGCFE